MRGVRVLRVSGLEGISGLGSSLTVEPAVFGGEMAYYFVERLPKLFPGKRGQTNRKR